MPRPARSSILLLTGTTAVFIGTASMYERGSVNGPSLAFPLIHGKAPFGGSQKDGTETGAVMGPLTLQVEPQPERRPAILVLDAR